MAKPQLLPSDELKLQLGIVQEIFEEFQPVAEKIGFLEREIILSKLLRINFQSAVQKVKQDSAQDGETTR